MRRIVVLLGSVGLAFACASCTQPLQSDRTVRLVGPAGENVRVAVEIADEDQERVRGLMFRSSLPEGYGMLFVVPREQVLSFWMKDTAMPLDVLFFRVDGMFIGSRSMEPCAADPCPSYVSQQPAQYALEVPGGFALREGIGQGWRIEL